jgi:hypothetical protein
MYVRRQFNIQKVMILNSLTSIIRSVSSSVSLISSYILPSSLLQFFFCFHDLLSDQYGISLLASFYPSFTEDEFGELFVIVHFLQAELSFLSETVNIVYFLDEESYLAMFVFNFLCDIVPRSSLRADLPSKMSNRLNKGSKN